MLEWLDEKAAGENGMMYVPPGRSGTTSGAGPLVGQARPRLARLEIAEQELRLELLQRRRRDAGARGQIVHILVAALGAILDNGPGGDDTDAVERRFQVFVAGVVHVG